MKATEILELTPEQIAKLPSKQIPALVEAAIQLDRSIKSCGKVLESLKERLVHEGEAEAAAQQMNPIGTAWTFLSAQGEAAEVNFPKPGLIRGFYFVDGIAWQTKGRDQAVRIGDLLGPCGDRRTFQKLFMEHWKPAKAFRELVPKILTPAAAAKLLPLCEEPSSPRVSFKTKE